MLTGLADLNRRVARESSGQSRFSELSHAQQIEMLREIEDGQFFGTVRFQTVVGTFAHPNWGGNYEGTGYQILGFEQRYIWQPPFGEYDAEVGR